MKKLKLFCLFLSLALLVMPGCEPDDPPTPPVIIKDPTIKVSSDHDTVAFNETAMITIVAENTDSITSDLDGVRTLKVNGSCEITIESPKLTETTTYHFVAYNHGKVSTTNVTVVVKPEVIIPLTLVVSMPDSVAYNTPATISWTTTSCTSLTINGTPVSVNSNKTTLALKIPNTFIFKAKNSNGDSIIVSKTIFVKAPTIADYLNGKWMILSWRTAYTADGPWTEYSLSDCDKDDIWIFDSKSKTYVLDYIQRTGPCPSGVLEGKWTLDGSTIVGLGGRQVFHIDWNTLVWRYWSIEINGNESIPIIVEETFYKSP